MNTHVDKSRRLERGMLPVSIFSQVYFREMIQLSLNKTEENAEKWNFEQHREQPGQNSNM